MKTFTCLSTTNCQKKSLQNWKNVLQDLRSLKSQTKQLKGWWVTEVGLSLLLVIVLNYNLVVFGGSVATGKMMYLTT